MTGARLRVAVAGAGMISHHHLVGWRRHPSVDVIAICDPDEERARKRCAEFDVPLAFHDFGAMLRDMRPDAVDIASPMETHAPLVLGEKIGSPL